MGKKQNKQAEKLYKRLKSAGLSKEKEARILDELNSEQEHELPTHRFQDKSEKSDNLSDKSFYTYSDMDFLQRFSSLESNYTLNIQSIDDLLERDKQKEKDGFSRKIRIGRLIKPGRSGKDRFVIVPTTVEEKFIHDRVRQTDSEEDSSSGGSGDGEEGEVIGEQPVREGSGEGTGPGQGESGPHEIESSAYDLGKILTEKFELPNLKDKGKKKSLTRYSYDLTDRNRGFGQILDKKATLRQIVETNLNLGNIPDINDIDPTSFIIAPQDKIYRILSKEKDYESQAMVFFIRDYSGSMSGKPTELVVTQHILIYSWLLYQYANQVESRFILHDTEAKEVPDFYTYYNSKVAGGTQVSSAFKLVNKIVIKENLEPDYNIYIFHGTDGDDWDSQGKKAIPELKKMIKYSNRIGITIAQNSYSSGSKSEVQRYIEKSGLLNSHPDKIRMDVVNDDANEARLIEGIKKLIS